VFFIVADSILVRDEHVGFKFSTGSAIATYSTNFDPLAGVTVEGSFRGILDPRGPLSTESGLQTEPLPFRPIEIDFRRGELVIGVDRLLTEPGRSAEEGCKIGINSKGSRGTERHRLPNCV
jgi:hypothetical protein